MAIFERRHYQAIAEELKCCYVYAVNPRECELMEHMMESFVVMFEVDNPNFKRERFLKACGMEDGT